MKNVRKNRFVLEKTHQKNVNYTNIFQVLEG